MGVYLVTADPTVAAAVGAFLAAHEPAPLNDGAWLVEVNGDGHDFFEMVTKFAGQQGDIGMLEVTGRIWARGQHGDNAVAWMMQRSR